jgi:CheY-like chemotaxis protein
MKVLIVEDSQPMRHLISSIVGDLAEVFECEDGGQALSMYEQHRPNWVLMDVRMKELNGIEATRLIISKYPEAQIMIVTNYDDQRLRKSSCRAGACGYVLKEDLFDLRRILTAASEPVM